jgi:transposase-like protein
MKKKRKQHSAAFKAQVALAALKEDRSTSELAGHFGVHPTLINAWRKQLLAGVEDLFARGVQVPAAAAEAQQAQLYEQIGRLKVELDWLKKKAGAAP